jgi:betaine lipid synthase
MDNYLPIASFDAIYLIDLCEPLLQIARRRFDKKGWKNITVLCQDASEFSLPEWLDGRDPKGSVGYITMSYSLSMVCLYLRTSTLLRASQTVQIPNFYPLLDRIDYVLSPDDGLLGVVDFYTSGKQPSLHEKAIGGTSKECGWLSRWFWQIWFDFDHVSLSPHRRDYLEYKFGTVSFTLSLKI